MIRYGLNFPDEMSEAQVELWGYANPDFPGFAGLGKQAHLKNAMMLLWPHLYAGEVEPGVPRWRDDLELLTWAWCNYRIVSVIGHASAAKCLGKGTLVLRYDGARVPVEDVKPGDLLMGDDSTPRKVLSTTRGVENLYRVVPSRGDAWVCNESHILSLKASYTPRGAWKFSKGDVEDIPVRDFLRFGQVKRRVWKQFRVGVDFPPQAKPLEFDPYIYGLWLGDGDTKTPVFSQQHNACSREWVAYWESRGARVWSSDGGTVPRFAPRFPRDGRKPNPFTQFIRGSVDAGGKRIRHEYLTASYGDRLQLLAGIIDTDGTADKASFSITTTLPGLADDYAFLARSLGFDSTVRERATSVRSTGFKGRCFKVAVHGEVARIPTRLKLAHVIRGKRDPLLQEIRLEPLGPGEYFGFEIGGNRRFLLGDFTVTHNTHTFGHIAAASYIADSLNSIITLTSTHLTGLRKRLWSDTVSAIKTAHIGNGVLGGHHFDVRTHDMTIRPAGSKEDKYVIEGIATDRGQDAVEKIQGTHSRRRRYVIIDEAQGTPSAIFEASSNLMTDPDFRIVMLANPTRRYSTFGTWCEPENGWSSIDPEIDQHWTTKKGGICIRLDGLKSANIKAGKTLFPFLVRQDYLDSVAKAFGVGSPRWWTFVRGWFAPEGLFGVIYPGAVLNKAEEKVVYQSRPTQMAALDPAFEGGDQCSLVIGEYGNARGSKWAMNVSQVINIKVAVTETSDPLDFLIAKEVMRVCKENDVAPENFIMDTTGAGRGVAAILEKDWSRLIHKCNFGGAATTRKLKVSDTETSDQLFDRFVSELWWAGRAWMEEGLVGNVTHAFKTLREQLSARQYETVKDKKISIEPKREMKERLGYSPDEADAFVMLVELLRRKGATAGSEFSPATGSRRDAAQKRAVRYSQIENPDRAYTHAH